MRDIRISTLYYRQNEPLGELDKRFVLLCERKICPALLLEKIYTYSYWAREKSQCDSDDYCDPAIYNTVQGIADWFLGLFETDQIEEALRYLANKQYILAMHTLGSHDWKIECNLRKVDEDCKLLQFQKIPIHAPQCCLEEEQRQAEQKKHFKSYTAEAIFKEKSLEDEEKRKVKFQNSRAAKAKLPATLTIEQWLETLEHFDWKCAYCGGKYSMLEHFIPLNHGKGTTWDNCVPACGGCNTLKQAWNPLNGWGPELTSIKEGIERVQAYLATRG